MSITPEQGPTGSSEAAEALSQGQELQCSIEGVTASGAGRAVVSGLPVIVPGAVPGEKVSVTILRVHPRYAEAKLIKLVQPSLDAIAPKCAHIDCSGGTGWQKIPYQKQLQYKEQIVRDALEHVGIDEKQRKNLPGRVLSIIPSPQVFHYRNTLELSFGMSAENKPSLGFRRPGKKETVLPITDCALYDEQLASLISRIDQFMQQTNLPVYNPRSRKGILRSLILRRGVHTDEHMVCFLAHARKKELEPLFQHFMKFAQDPRVQSLLVVEHLRSSLKPDHPTMHPLKGGTSIKERLFDLTFELSPFSRFLSNTQATEKLYQAVAQVADLSGRETLLDCYCGIGALGQYLSRFVSKVVGVEANTTDIGDALNSAGTNKIGNISFYKGLPERVLTGQLTPGGKYNFDCIVASPPRAGMGRKVISAILDHNPEKIVYVSCNVTTFARDLAEFLTKGYELRVVQPVDLFPNTAHVETVALLQKS